MVLSVVISPSVRAIAQITPGTGHRSYLRAIWQIAHRHWAAHDPSPCLCISPRHGSPADASMPVRRIPGPIWGRHRWRGTV